jgi:hypothetical protein
MHAVMKLMLQSKQKTTGHAANALAATSSTTAADEDATIATTPGSSLSQP